jgi:CheY-like chemotaxis protein
MTRILLVEDEHNIRFITALNLQMHTYEVAEAWDGLEALYLLCNGEVDLITDLIMPYMSGLDLIKWLKREYDHMPVIAVSAYENSLKDAVALGADAVLRKPFAPQQLLHVTRNVLDSCVH